ncbi:carboxylesterase family domain-containing protein [Phthorimaea operculella]|nr:carboxylesterase family domain-containing protein [Phthorimaea operculella]
MRSLGALVLILLIQQNVEARIRIDPLVESKVGLIRGLRSNDGDYSMFLGIPFGKVDEANPFGVASPFPKFDGVFLAYKEAPACPQIDIFSGKPTGSLDCLGLNIYVPSSASSQNRLPVLVWIHGGAFIQGNGNRDSSDPKFLIRHDVIFVSLQYRLGPYGFICLGTPEIPGNQGLKDQVLALRWIKENIASFGGDVNKITIFGQSAGAISVDLHLYSEQEKLFNQVIMNSGSAFMPAIRNEADPKTLVNLAERLGLSTDNDSEALSFLRKADPGLVVAAAEQMDPWLMYPCIEKKFDNVERFLGDYPMNINAMKTKQVPVLIGFTSHECYLCVDNELELRNYVKWQLEFNFDADRSYDMVTYARHFYIGDEKFEDSLLGISEMASDMTFVYPVKRALEKLLQSGADKVYYYMFSYSGQRNYNLATENVSIDGALHSDDLGYLFEMNAVDFPKTISHSDQLMIDRMTTMWTNFVKYGNPTPETSQLLPVKWEPITSPDSPHYYLNINTQMKLEKRPFTKRTTFWDLFYAYNQKFLKAYREE